MLVTFCVNPHPPGPSDHLSVAQSINQLTLECEWASDNDSPGGKIDSGAQSGRGDKNADCATFKGALNYVTLIKGETCRAIVS